MFWGRGILDITVVCNLSEGHSVNIQYVCGIGIRVIRKNMSRFLGGEVIIKSISQETALGRGSIRFYKFLKMVRDSNKIKNPECELTVP